MKKIYSFFVAGILATGLLNAAATDVVIGDGEDGTNGPKYNNCWAGTADVIENPLKTGNTTDSVILYKPGQAWGGISWWLGNNFFTEDYSKIVVDVYVTAATQIKLHIDNGTSKNIEQFKDAVVGQWTTLEFSLASMSKYDYQQMAFQNSGNTDVYFDNIRLVAKPGKSVNKVIVGKVDNSEDFDAYVDVTYDADSVYVKFLVTDDSIVGTGTVYQVDNIEVYFDMNNSKRVHQPRNGGWMSGDTTFDKDDYQFRLIPGVDFSTNNGLKGVRQVYTVTKTGYEFLLNICLDSLKKDFTAEVGKEIGFEVLISDNDDAANVNDANRNQITLNSLSDKVFNDPSLWATMKFAADGAFELIRSKAMSTQFVIENVVVGKVDNEKDFSATVDLKWDVDSIYATFVVVDDSIVSNGTNYQVDNIEVYFDMNNSKRVHWPRNGGWMSGDTTFDKDDYQLRLVPDSAFNVNNSLKGVNQIYSKNDTGYVFVLSIALDSLKAGYNGAFGNKIGFDVLISDNDDAANVNDANRNQITFNSLTDKPFNDPSLWATLELSSSPSFILVEDTQKPGKPGAPAAVAADGDVTITWNPSSDNTAVNSYIIFQADAAIDTIVALAKDNKFVVKGLANGDYKFSVAAIDIYGLVSDKAEASVSINTKVNNTSVASLNLFPNPATDFIGINNAGNATVQVFNTSGQLVLVKSIAANEKINVSALNNGIYSVRITENSNVSVVKMIKK